MTNKTLSVAHWVANLSHPVASLDAWCGRVERILKKAAKAGCDILVMPEYISEHWMTFAPAGLKPTEELGWCAAQAQRVIPRLQEAVRATGVALVAGTMPWPGLKGRWLNRAWMLFPDRAPVAYDKLALTPFEKDPASWLLQPGKTVRVFSWRGFRLAMLVCLDIEMPALSHRIAGEGIDLILVPSMTEKPSGYYRVFNCARARAVELMTAVSVVGCVGGALRKGTRRTKCWSGAAVYLPSEEVFGYDGIFAEVPLHGRAAGDGRIMIAKDIPLGKIRALRRRGAEVWPGPWSADGLKIGRE